MLSANNLQSQTARIEASKVSEAGLRRDKIPLSAKRILSSLISPHFVSMPEKRPEPKSES